MQDLALAQVMEAVRNTRDEVTAMRREVAELTAQMVTKADLRDYLPRETYDAYHKPLIEDIQMANGRITDLERELRGVRDKLSDRLTSSQIEGMGRTEAVRSQASGQMDRFKDLLLGGLAALALAMLMYLLTHPR